MTLTGGEITLDRGHDGRVAYLTLRNGRYTIMLWFTTLIMRPEAAASLIGLPFDNR